MTQFTISEMINCAQSFRVVKIAGSFSYCTLVRGGHIMTIIPTARASRSVQLLTKILSLTDGSMGELCATECCLYTRSVYSNHTAQDHSYQNQKSEEAIQYR
jgi:hypothetical protein